MESRPLVGYVGKSTHGGGKSSSNQRNVRVGNLPLYMVHDKARIDGNEEGNLYYTISYHTRTIILDFCDSTYAHSGS